MPGKKKYTHNRKKKRDKKDKNRRDKKEDDNNQDAYQTELEETSTTSGISSLNIITEQSSDTSEEAALSNTESSAQECQSETAQRETPFQAENVPSIDVQFITSGESNRPETQSVAEPFLLLIPTQPPEQEQPLDLSPKRHTPAAESLLSPRKRQKCQSNSGELEDLQIVISHEQPFAGVDVDSNQLQLSETQQKSVIVQSNQLVSPKKRQRNASSSESEEQLVLVTSDPSRREDDSEKSTVDPRRSQKYEPISLELEDAQDDSQTTQQSSDTSPAICVCFSPKKRQKFTSINETKDENLNQENLPKTSEPSPSRRPTGEIDTPVSSEEGSYLLPPAETGDASDQASVEDESSLIEQQIDLITNLKKTNSPQEHLEGMRRKSKSDTTLNTLGEGQLESQNPRLAKLLTSPLKKKLPRAHSIANVPQESASFGETSSTNTSKSGRQSVIQIIRTISEPRQALPKMSADFFSSSIIRILVGPHQGLRAQDKNKTGATKKLSNNQALPPSENFLPDDVLFKQPLPVVLRRNSPKKLPVSATTTLSQYEEQQRQLQSGTVIVTPPVNTSPKSPASRSLNFDDSTSPKRTRYQPTLTQPEELPRQLLDNTVIDFTNNPVDQQPCGDGAPPQLSPNSNSSKSPASNIDYQSTSSGHSYAVHRRDGTTDYYPIIESIPQQFREETPSNSPSKNPAPSFNYQPTCQIADGNRKYYRETPSNPQQSREGMPSNSPSTSPLNINLNPNSRNYEYLLSPDGSITHRLPSPSNTQQFGERPPPWQSPSTSPYSLSPVANITDQSTASDLASLRRQLQDGTIIPRPVASSNQQQFEEGTSPPSANINYQLISSRLPGGTMQNQPQTCREGTSPRHSPSNSPSKNPGATVNLVLSSSQFIHRRCPDGSIVNLPIVPSNSTILREETPPRHSSSNSASESLGAHLNLELTPSEYNSLDYQLQEGIITYFPPTESILQQRLLQGSPSKSPSVNLDAISTSDQQQFLETTPPQSSTSSSSSNSPTSGHQQFIQLTPPSVSAPKSSSSKSENNGASTSGCQKSSPPFTFDYMMESVIRETLSSENPFQSLIPANFETPLTSQQNEERAPKRQYAYPSDTEIPVEKLKKLNIDPRSYQAQFDLRQQLSEQTLTQESLSAAFAQQLEGIFSRNFNFSETPQPTDQAIPCQKATDDVGTIEQAVHVNLLIQAEFIQVGAEEVVENREIEHTTDEDHQEQINETVRAIISSLNDNASEEQPSEEQQTTNSGANILRMVYDKALEIFLMTPSGGVVEEQGSLGLKTVDQEASCSAEQQTSTTEESNVEQKHEDESDVVVQETVAEKEDSCTQQQTSATEEINVKEKQEEESKTVTPETVVEEEGSSLQQQTSATEAINVTEEHEDNSKTIAPKTVAKKEDTKVQETVAEVDSGTEHEKVSETVTPKTVAEEEDGGTQKQTFPREEVIKGHEQESETVVREKVTEEEGSSIQQQTSTTEETKIEIKLEK